MWRTRDNFEVSDAGNNKLLFAFQSGEDVEKVLVGEPWSFDRHLVLFQWYKTSTPIEELNFDKVLFWIQIHNLPYSLLFAEVARSIGESLGKVSMPKATSELRWDNFLRIRVAIDVNEQLCRVKRVRFDKDDDGWVSFAYERLPNLCYWCGQLNHDDKDCAIWLRSRGSLLSRDQQYGALLRAGQFNPSKKMVIEHSLVVAAPVEEGSAKSIGEVEAENYGSNNTYADFEAVIQGLDEAIRGDSGFQISNEEDIGINMVSDGGELSSKESENWAITMVMQDVDQLGNSNCQ
ncbi:hypothetical protein SO802_004847 [Lithocarpus litseifolius]|uniref:DUF4283 domain-containing protein n=1 Tax=Lithocarpus litseifolius TaxID=425828 RepID=A0AAW2DHZ0_9ROSI